MAFGSDRQTSFARATDSAVIDEGLRTYMLRVYNYMGSALALTGIVAYLTANSPVMMNAIFGTPLMWVVMLAPLGIVFFLSAKIQTMSATAAQATFWIFAVLMGMSLASIFVVYTGTSIARVFFITAGVFGTMSLYGYTTKRDLTGWGSFLFMGLIGIILASIVNWFLPSSAGLRRPDRLRHPEDQGDVRFQRFRRGDEQEGHHGSAQALSRLHQPVPHAAAPVRQPQLGPR